MNLIEILEKEEMARLTAGKTIPAFRAGDTVIVSVNVVEGSRRPSKASLSLVVIAVSILLSRFARSRRAKAWNVRSSFTPR